MAFSTCLSTVGGKQLETTSGTKHVFPLHNTYDTHIHTAIQNKVTEHTKIKKMGHDVDPGILL